MPNLDFQESQMNSGLIRPRHMHTFKFQICRADGCRCGAYVRNGAAHYNVLPIHVDDYCLLSIPCPPFSVVAVSFPSSSSHWMPMRISDAVYPGHWTACNYFISQTMVEYVRELKNEFASVLRFGIHWAKYRFAAFKPGLCTVKGRTLYPAKRHFALRKAEPWGEQKGSLLKSRLFYQKFYQDASYSIL